MTASRPTPRVPTISRRRALKTLFCSSAALALNLRNTTAAEVAPQARHWLSIGDFGTTGEFQVKVAAAMRGFVERSAIQPEGLLLLGDNFYSRDKDGFTVESPRWKKWFEDVYPASHFPNRCYSILGNHDYHDNPGGEQVQLAYAKRNGTRWTMPAKWYRFEIGEPQHLVTVLALDSNLPSVSGGKDKKTGEPRASLTKSEVDQQQAWFRAELAKPRAPFTIVLGHHPLYSNGSHGDTPALIEQWGDLLEQHRVHMYLCGHDHDLQHLELDGKFTSFVLSGGGGARTRELKGTHQVPFARDVYGFSHLQVLPDRLTVAHHGLDGSQLHRFTKRVDGGVEVA
jgi:hypothetical protein